MYCQRQNSIHAIIIMNNLLSPFLSFSLHQLQLSNKLATECVLFFYSLCVLVFIIKAPESKKKESFFSQLWHTKKDSTTHPNHMLIMQRHNYTITRVFATLFIIYGNVVYVCMWCPIIVGHRLHYYSALLADVKQCQAYTQKEKREEKKKSHCRLNGIKGGVVMNTNARTSSVIVSLSHAHAHYNHMHIHVPECVHLHISITTAAIAATVYSVAHILLLLMNFLPFSIFGCPEKKQPKMNWLTPLWCYFSLEILFFFLVFTAHFSISLSKKIHSSLRWPLFYTTYRWVFSSLGSFEWAFFFVSHDARVNQLIYFTMSLLSLRPIRMHC